MAHRKKLSRSFEKFRASLEKLNQSLSPEFKKRYESEILIEIVTKRFEYTFESLWKCLKEILLTEGIESVSPLGCFKEAFKLGLIAPQYEETYPLMVKKRNEIVHIYSDEDALEIFQLIQNHFFRAIQDTFKNVEEKIR